MEMCQFLILQAKYPIEFIKEDSSYEASNRQHRRIDFLRLSFFV